MPKGYRVQEEDFGSLGEQLLGRGEHARSTKTYIESGSLAMFLGMFRGFPESLINAGRRLHADEHGLKLEDVTAEMIFEQYPEAHELIDLFNQIIGTKGSQEGFLVTRYTSSNREEMDTREEKRKSSGEVERRDSRWN